MEHFFRQGLPNGRDHLFQRAELGSPGRSSGAIDTIHQVFCHAFEVGELFSYSGGRFLVFCHPWLLQAVGSRKMGNLTQESTTLPLKAANRVVHPTTAGRTLYA